MQKLTLLDYPGEVACTIFTQGCNYRYPFCYNPSLVLPEQAQKALPEEDVLTFLEKRKGCLDGVAVTGGEPLLHNDLEQLLEKIKKMGYRIKLDTNGTFPQRLQALVRKIAEHYKLPLRRLHHRSRLRKQQRCCFPWLPALIAV